MKDFHEGDIPPFLRKVLLPPLEEAHRIVATIDERVAWLSKRGLRPHPQVIENKLHCLAFIRGEVIELEMCRFMRGGVF